MKKKIQNKISLTPPALYSRSVFLGALFFPLLFVGVFSAWMYLRYLALEQQEKKVLFVEKLVSTYQMGRVGEEKEAVNENYVEQVFSTFSCLEREKDFYSQICSIVAFDQLFQGVLERKNFLEGMANQLSWAKKEEGDCIFWNAKCPVEMNVGDMQAFFSAFEGKVPETKRQGGARPNVYFSKVEVRPCLEGAFDTYLVDFQLVQKRNQ